MSNSKLKIIFWDKFENLLSLLSYFQLTLCKCEGIQISNSLWFFYSLLNFFSSDCPEYPKILELLKSWVYIYKICFPISHVCHLYIPNYWIEFFHFYLIKIFMNSYFMKIIISHMFEVSNSNLKTFPSSWKDLSFVFCFFFPSCIFLYACLDF